MSKQSAETHISHVCRRLVLACHADVHARSLCTSLRGTLIAGFQVTCVTTSCGCGSAPQNCIARKYARTRESTHEDD